MSLLDSVRSLRRFPFLFSLVLDVGSVFYPYMRTVVSFQHTIPLRSNKSASLTFSY
jgi:hypothetical protein